MRLRRVNEIKNFKGKRVLVREDFNVPIKSGRVTENVKIKRSLETIRFLSKKGAIVVLASHLGRPEGRAVKKYSLKPVAVELSRLLKRRVKFFNAKVPNKKFKKQISKLKNGEIVLLENTRFYAEEKKNSADWSRKLAGNFDYFVNDAFASCHRAHASVVGVTKYLPSYAGFNLLDEVINLSVVLERPSKPLVVAIGGAKISTKIKVIKNFIPRAKFLLLGGGLANNILKVQGCELGDSLVDKEGLGQTKKLKKYFNKKIILPPDVVIGNTKSKKKIGVVKISQAYPDICKRGQSVFDLGPESVKLYKTYIKEAKMVIWNGPFGYIEVPAYARATKELAKAMAISRARTYIGGGETLMIVNKLKLMNRYTFVSTGGGAMLEFLEGKKLPGLQPLKK